MIRLDKIKIERIMKKELDKIVTYSLLQVLVSPQILNSPNKEIYLNTRVFDKLLLIQKALTDVIKVHFGVDTITVKNIVSTTICDEYRISGISNKVKAFDIEEDELILLLEAYKVAKVRKIQYIKAHVGKQIIVQFKLADESVYVTLRNS